jgi:hypothetical protein
MALRNLVVTAALTVALVAASGSATAVVLDFEDARFSGGLLPPPNDDLLIDQEIPGYGPTEVELVWGPIAVLDVPGNLGPTNFPTFPGWYNGVNCVPPNVSGACNGAYNVNGAIVATVSAMGSPLYLGGFNLTSSQGTQRVKITGLVGSSPALSVTRFLSASDAPAATFVALGWTGLTGFEIAVVDETGNPLPNPVASWVLDNVEVTAVPEPGTWATMGLGLFGLLLLRRLRRAD